MKFTATQTATRKTYVSLRKLFEALNLGMVRMRGLEPPRLTAPDPKSGVSANFTTSAYKND